MSNQKKSYNHSTKTNNGRRDSRKKDKGNPEKLIHQLMPYILGVSALFLLICFFLSDSTGVVGNFLKDLMFGLFSNGAWTVPFIVLNIGVFWKRDVAAASLKYKLTFSFICVTLISVLVHAFSANAVPTLTESFNGVTLFKLGCTGEGGGFFGGILGNLLLRGFGFVGTLIFSVALLLLFGIFLFGMTPHKLAVYMITGIREWRTGLSLRMGEAKAERARMLDEYEIERAEKKATAVVPTEKYSRRMKKGRIDDNLDENTEESDGKFFDANEALEEDVPASSDGVVVESDAPPFDTGNGGIFVQREGLSPMPRTGAQELEEIEGEEIDLAKIFAEPAGESTDESAQDQSFGEGDIITAAELDLMVEKSRLAHEPIVPNEPEDDLTADGDENFMAVNKGAAHGEQMRIDYVFPPISLLRFDKTSESADMSAEIEQTARKLVETLRSFNVKTKIINVSRGPTITRYELQPEIGTKVRSIVNLVDDISLHLATSGVRIEAPIPGKEAVGIEVPNRSTATVYIRELLEDAAFKTSKSKVLTGLGTDVAGNPIYLDVAKMPHLLIAGTTGSGKSVCINSLIISILYKARPDEVKFILIDPKKVELNVYNGIPHLLVPVVSDPKKAAGSLHWAVSEMERRYELIEGAGVRNIKGYNDSVANDPEAEKLPQIVIIIDELADLMMTAKDDVEEAICRIAQKARAAGMHLIIGTQRPSVDVITGLIKANVPSRIAFTTVSQVDSRTIIDIAGAEKLIGRGDMLFSPVGSIKPVRVQGSFVSDDEVEAVTAFVKNNYGVREYDQSVIDTIEREAQLCGNKKATVLGDGDEEANDGDPMLKPAIQLAVESGKISTSLIQRRLQLGYGRAAKLIDTMEKMGIVSPPQGQKPRDVLISKEEFLEMELRRGE